MGIKFEKNGMTMPTKQPEMIAPVLNSYELKLKVIEYRMCLTPRFNNADKKTPVSRPGMENINAWMMMVTMMLLVLKPSALSIPNSKVLSSTSESIREYTSWVHRIARKKTMMVMVELKNTVISSTAPSCFCKGVLIVTFESRDKLSIIWFPASPSMSFMFYLVPV